jgi:hypothetical protein
MIGLFLITVPPGVRGVGWPAILAPGGTSPACTTGLTTLQEGALNSACEPNAPKSGAVDPN